jgi:uncharacterized protein (TIGR02266 family)
MSYVGAAAAAQSRELLGMVLETLQRDTKIPQDVLVVTQNIAQAVGALFEAERASSDLDGKSSVKHAMGSLSQTMALLQDVKTRHDGIDAATRTLAEVMSRLYPLAQAPTHRPSLQSGAAGGPRVSVPSAAPVPREALSSVPPGSREKLEANVGATTESNFFVGFSGEISEGGVFVATYLTLPLGARVDVLVTLPGGFEKNIPGTVRFVRDPMDMESEPGVGVRFDRLDNEARELILRFIRKRPPLFYDE